MSFVLRKPAASSERRSTSRYVLLYARSFQQPT